MENILSFLGKIVDKKEAGIKIVSWYRFLVNNIGQSVSQSLLRIVEEMQQRRHSFLPTTVMSKKLVISITRLSAPAFYWAK